MSQIGRGNRRIIIIGGTSWLYDRARHLGIEVVLVQKPSLVTFESMQAVKRTVVIDYEQDPMLLPILKAMHDEAPFDTCLTLTESALLVAAKINQELGLIGVTPNVVELTRDKFKMREHLRQQGFAPVRARLANDVHDVIQIGKEFGYPLILKPRSGVGSQKIHLVEQESQIIELASVDLIEADTLVEEYLEGPEYSVESFTFGGQHTIFAITEKKTLPNNFVEYGHRVPAVISTESSQQIKKHVEQFLTAIGVTEGPTHTELKWTTAGPRVIETHTRLGGDSIPDLVQLSTGFDLRSITLGWFCGLIDPIVSPQPATGGAAIQFLLPPPGRIERYSGVEAARCVRNVVRVEINRKPGDIIPKIRSSSDRVGYVITTGETSEEASRLCEEIVDQIRLNISHSEGVSR